MNTQAQNYSNVAVAESLDSSNHNISSVLSQIQDHGPAYTESKKRDNLVQLKADAKKSSSELRDEELLGNDLYSKASILSSGNRVNNAKNSAKTWVLSSLLLFMIIGVAFLIYKLDDRTNKIEALLSDYNGDIKESIESYNKVSPTILSLNTELTSVKNELEKVKSNVDVVSQESVQVDNRVIQDEIVSTLMDEIQILKIELEKANNSLSLKQGDRDVVQVDSDKNIKPIENLSVTWKVNLASLSNKIKVDEIVNRLINEGLNPLVDEVVVAGKRIYRLSVVGFAEIKQAEQFILFAEKEYGMKDAWIRKVKQGNAYD